MSVADRSSARKTAQRIGSAVKNRNRDPAEDLLPALPPVNGSEIVCPHEPDEADAWLTALQAGDGIDCKARSKVFLEARDGHAIILGKGACPNQPVMEWQHVGVEFEWIAGAHEPPYVIETETPPGKMTDKEVTFVGRIERSPEKADHMSRAWM